MRAERAKLLERSVAKPCARAGESFKRRRGTAQGIGPLLHGCEARGTARCFHRDNHLDGVADGRGADRDTNRGCTGSVCDV